MNDQQQTKRWVIEGQFKLTTPMHLGTGLDEEEGENWIEAIALDHLGQPYIPGASIKGALRALAKQCNCPGHLVSLFGDLNIINGETKSTAGQAEFYNAHYVNTHNEAFDINNITDIVPRVAIDRVTGAAVDKKLFNARLVNPGTIFGFKIVVQKADEQEISFLLGLLALAGTDPQFSLGAGYNQTQGRIDHIGETTTRYFGKAEAEKWYQSIMQGENKSWQHIDFTKPKSIDPATLGKQPDKLKLPLALQFHTPFLVKKADHKADGEADSMPRRNYDQQIILPASSLRGRLRTQAERILRTLCQEIPQGHHAPAYQKQQPHKDLITLLFGTAGWKGIIQTEDCVVSNTTLSETLPRHEMVAIDRFTGGGKEGAKFNVDYVECPELVGHLHLDIKRLKNAKLESGKNGLNPVLGLITLLLRDLAEGDIPFGYGVNKGYGQCREDLVLSKWETVLSTPGVNLTIETVLSAFRGYLNDPQPTALNLSSIKGDGNNALENLPQPKNYEAGAFHNPYHFIPLNEPNTTDWPEIKSQNLIQKGHSHDRYQGLSGRIVCQLTTKTPLFIGSKSTSGGNNKPTQIDPFIFQKKHAIPATSLRGMLSSLFESISGSNFRVLHPQSYSMRKTFNDGGALSAMGRIVTTKDGKLKLQPLTLPTLERKGDHYIIPNEWKKIFKKYKPLRVHFDSAIRNYMSDQLYAMRVEIIPPNDTNIIETNNNALRFPSGDGKGNYLIGHCHEGQTAYPLEDISSMTQKKQKRFTHGWVRTLKDQNRQLPAGVKHHVFLPDTPDTPKIPLLDIEKAKKRFHELADLALAGMHLKDKEEKHDHEILPYTPIGRRKDDQDRPEKDQNPKNGQNGMSRYATRLKEGDLIFFDVDKKTSEVTEISFSSIWRTGIGSENRLKTTADLLKNSDENLLPLGMDKSIQDRDSNDHENENENEYRNKLSPVERLFGVVEYRDPQRIESKPSEKQAFAYAGKVRIGFGLPAADVSIDDEPITLKELASPKPPSPTLYLKTDHDVYLSKAMVASDKTGAVKLRGRKYYLHAWRQNGQAVELNKTGIKSGNGNHKSPWKTHKEWANNAQQETGDNNYITERQVEIQPIKAGNIFHFEIDFNNLDETELAQLCATLQPSAQFEHRLGMGKPLGLGSVKIEPLGLYLTNRKQRYATDTLNTPRYHTAWQNKNIKKETWPEHYQHEKCANTIAESNFDFSLFTCKGLPDAEKIKRALALFGDPKMIVMPVHYPLQIGGLMEKEQLKWFVNNDRRNADKQHLESITPDTTKIPTLNKN